MRAMPTGVFVCYLALFTITTAACFFPVPVSLHLLTDACAIIYIGSYNSVLAESKEAGEQMETKDVYMFPVLGSIVLFSLYLIIKFVDKDMLNFLIRMAFVVFGTLVLAQKLSQFLSRLLPAEQVASLTAKKIEFQVPFMKKTGPHPPEQQQKEKEKEQQQPQQKEKEQEQPAEPYLVEVNALDAIGLLVALAVGYSYLKHNHWVTTNCFGIAFSIQGIELIGLGSYFNGAVFLIGLFVYDIFWVFGTGVMVTVAKNFDVPIKLLFPQMEASLVDGVLLNRPSMLGLGDIVVPGIFVALMLRFDLTQKSETPRYFHACLLGYFLGLATTVFVMFYFGAAQPALLYLSPACLGASLLLAVSRGEVNKLIHYEEDAKPKTS